MTVEEFSKYFIDNISRATVSNALKVTIKVNDTDYMFNDFVKGIITYTETCIKENRFKPSICYGILYICDKYSRKYNSEIKYSKEYIVNDFIIDLWRLVNGD